MRTFKLSLISITIMLSPHTAVADFFTGNQFHEVCQSEASYSEAICSGYVVGIADIMANEPVYGFTACLPTNVTVRQVSDVVSTYMQQHPEMRHYAASSIVAYALSESFPCG